MFSLVPRSLARQLAGLVFVGLPCIVSAAAPVTRTSPQAVPTAPMAQSRMQTLNFSQFGVRLINVEGDFNHDGYPDLVVANPVFSNGETQEGSIDIFYGSATGYATQPGFHYELNAEFAGLGSSPTVADVNGDGFADLIVGATNYGKPGGEPSTGAIFVFFGSANGLSAQPSQVLYGIPGSMGSSFGNSIRKLGDFNHDGYADIVVSAQTHSDVGVLEVFVGSPTGLVATPKTLIWAPANVVNFGGIFDAGDTNGDGYVDVLVAERDYQNTGGGKIRVFRGGADGPATTPSEIIVGGVYGDSYGAEIAFLGDVNGDGFGDLAVAAPTAALDGESMGNITIYYGSAGGYNASLRSPQTLDPLGLGVFKGFGGRMRGGRDFNGDGYADLVIGTSYQSLLGASSPFPGNLWILPGGPNGIESGKTLVKLVGTPGSWDALGYGPMDVTDVNRDGRTDVITGAPLNGLGGSPYRLRIYFGTDRR